MPEGNGKTRVVYGPWQVVVRGLAGHAERRVLARWEVVHVVGGRDGRRTRDQRARAAATCTIASNADAVAAPACWKLRLCSVRASGDGCLPARMRLRAVPPSSISAGAERARWRGASETRIGSERRLLGASERL